MSRSTFSLLILVVACQRQANIPEHTQSPADAASYERPAATKQEALPTAKPKAALPDTCGNGKIDPDESCDDGNQQGGDGCSPRCRKEAVGFIMARVVDSDGRLHAPPFRPERTDWDPGKVLRFEAGTGMLEGKPPQLLLGGPPLQPLPGEFADQVDHFAGSGSTFVVALKNGEVWEVNAHLNPQTACKDRGLEQPGILAADGQRWCRWPRKAKRVIELHLSSHVEEGGAVFTRGKTFKREPLPSAKHLADHGGTTCAVLETGEVACWGMNSYGQVGYMSREVPDSGDDPGYFVADNPPKTFLKFPTPVKKVEVGHATLALTEGGELWCWGNCYDWPFADTGEPQPYWHRMRKGNSPDSQELKAIGESTMPSAPLKLPEACVPKDFRGGCVICEDGCLKCWHDKESLQKAECVTY